MSVVLLQEVAGLLNCHIGPSEALKMRHLHMNCSTE